MIKGSRLLRPFFAVAVVVLALAGAAAVWYVFDPGFRDPAVQVAQTGETPPDDLGLRIREYLLANPEVIVEAVQRLEERQRQSALSESRSLLASRTEQIFNHPESPVGGNSEGEPTLVEFFDYNCPYCRQVAPVMIEAEAADPALRIVYKEFPILGPNSLFAAKAALAAERQGKYAEFHKAMMLIDGPADEASAIAAATEIGLDIDRLRADMQDPSIQAEIDRNMELAGALRINGTPSFVVGDEILRGATDLATIQTLIEEARDSGSR
jgi:protein-disulfide isomerase